jgi:hypothetical protein
MRYLVYIVIDKQRGWEITLSSPADIEQWLWSKSPTGKLLFICLYYLWIQPVGKCHIIKNLGSFLRFKAQNSSVLIKAMVDRPIQSFIYETNI